MNSKICTSLWTILILASHSLHAQADTSKYKERAAAVEQEIWGWKLPAFNNYKVAAQYANESSVIMARRAEIQASSKKRLAPGIRIERSFYYNSTIRELVKINDKVSLGEYSQFSYRQFQKLNRWVSPTTTTFVGARIIKPDGSVRQVGIDETVLLQSPGNGPERKLAIAGLQVGDFLDMYIRTEEFSWELREPERLIFEFGEDHPILDYSIHCNIGNKYDVEYRSMNHSPDAQQTTNDDKDLILDMDMKDLKAEPTDLWMSPMRELPAFRINILAGGRSLIGHSGGVVKDVPLSDIIRQTAPQLDLVGSLMVTTQMNDLMKKYDSHFKKLPPDSLARLMYYVFRFDLYYNQLTDVTSMEVGEARNHMQMNTIPYLFNLHWMPEYLEGQPYIVLNRATVHGVQPDLTITAPVSTPEENIHREDLHIDIAEDMQLLHIKRQTTLTGRMKEDEQLHLLNFEDCYASEQQALHVEKSVMDDLKKARRKNNVSEDYAAALQHARASLKDRFKEEVASEFIEDPKEMLAWKIDNPGIRDYAPDFVYSTEFTMDGLFQRAGNNLLLSVGKAINSPLKMTASQRDRKVDIYMPYARTLDCSVSFSIPPGYAVMGVEKLNGKVANDCGSLTTTARIQGNQLIVQYRRIYKHNFESAVKWPELLAIIDAGNDFSGQKVLLKKG
jgi:hypothetical protein